MRRPDSRLKGLPVSFSRSQMEYALTVNSVLTLDADRCILSEHPRRGWEGVYELRKDRYINADITVYSNISNHPIKWSIGLRICLSQWRISITIAPFSE